MDDTFTAGQIVKVVDHLQSPNGLCFSSTPETVFVADGHIIKQVNFETNTITVAAQGFKQAFDVALSSNGNLGVTDVQAHKISILEEKENGNYWRYWPFRWSSFKSTTVRTHRTVF